MGGEVYILNERYCNTVQEPCLIVALTTMHSFMRANLFLSSALM